MKTKEQKIEMETLEADFYDDADLLELDEATALKSLKPEYGLIQRFWMAISNPARLFEDVDRAPRVLFPLLVLVLLTMLISFLNRDALMEVQRQALMNTYKQQGLTIPSDGFESILASIRIFTVLISGVSVAIALVIKGVVTNLIAGFFSSEGTFKRTISSFIYAYGVVLVGSFIGTIASMVTGVGLINFSPAMVLGAEAIGTPLYTLLSAFDIFALWYLWLSALGLQVVKKLSLPKALICVLVPYVIAIAFSILVA